MGPRIPLFWTSGMTAPDSGYCGGLTVPGLLVTFCGVSVMLVDVVVLLFLVLVQGLTR